MLLQTVKFSFFNGWVVAHWVNVHSCFIHSSTYGHLGCFQILAIVNNAAINIEVHIFFQISVLSFLQINSQKWNHCVIRQLHFYFFEVTPFCFPQWLHQSAFPPTVQKHSPFSTSSPALVICWFDDSPSDRCEVISHCGFNLHFSDD